MNPAKLRRTKHGSDAAPQPCTSLWHHVTSPRQHINHMAAGIKKASVMGTNGAALKDDARSKHPASQRNLCSKLGAKKMP